MTPNTSHSWRPYAASEGAVALVVEDDATTRAVLVRTLSKVAGMSTLAASSIAEARMILEVVTPHLLVLDLSLPDGVGTVLLSDFQGVGAPTVVIASANCAEFGPYGGEFARLVQLPKPVNLQALQRVGERVVSDEACPIAFSVPEYIQLGCLGGHSMQIVCSKGEIMLVDGQLSGARTPDATGLEALSELVDDSVVRLRPMNGAASDTPNLSGSWEGLLLDALRVSDEAQRPQEGNALASEFPDFDFGFEQFEGPLGGETSMPPAAGVTGWPAKSGAYIADRKRGERGTSRPTRRSLAPAPAPTEIPAADDKSLAEWLRLGQVHIVAGDLIRAEECYLRVLQLRPGHALAEHNLRRIRAILAAPATGF